MKKEDIKKVKDFYENVIMQQIIKPVEIQAIYELVAPHENPMQPYYKKMRAITLFVQGLQGDVLDGLEELFDEVEPIPDTDNPMSKNYVDKTDTALPDGSVTLSVDNETQSHREDVKIDPNTGLPFKVITDEEAQATLLADYEAAYKLASTANEKRSLTMKIKALKKKM